MADLVAVDGMVGLAYEAALDSARWADFLALFCQRLNSHTGMIWAHDFNSNAVDPALAGQDVFTQVGFSDAALASFSAYYAQRNVWLENPRLHQEGKVVNGTMLFPNNQLKKSEFWGDWARPQHIFYTAAAIVEKKHDRSVNMTVCRPESMGDYTEGEMALLRRLMPHLQAAFVLHRRLYRLEALSSAATGALQHIPFGVVLLDRQGQALFINQQAERMAATTRLLRLRDGGPVSCSRPRDDAQLQRLVHEATRTGAVGQGTPEEGAPGGGMRVSALDGQQLHLLVVPLPSWSSPFGLQTPAVIFISDPTSVLGSLVSLLRSMYGMTPAESRLTEALVNGRTPKEYTEIADVSLNTVRTQMKSIAAKLGVNRQSDLVRAVVTGLAIVQPMASHGPL